MANEITIEQVSCLTDNMEKAIPEIVSDAELLAANNAEALIKHRIFNEGKDANEASLTPKGRGPKEGAYSRQHARRRKNPETYKGSLYSGSRQINKVDLQFTDRLFISIQVFEQGGGPILGIVPGTRSDQPFSNIQLSEYLEGLYKTKIFAASEGEAEKVLSAVEAHVNRRIDELFSKCL